MSTMSLGSKKLWKGEGVNEVAGVNKNKQNCDCLAALFRVGFDSLPALWGEKVVEKERVREAIERESERGIKGKPGACEFQAPLVPRRGI